MRNSVNLHSENYTVPNKSSSQSDPESFSGFRGGSARSGYNKGGSSGGSGGHCHTGAGQFAYFQCQVCFKFGHTAVFVAIAMINIINQILP